MTDCGPKALTATMTSGRSPYNAYLREKGYEGDNPWHDFANAGIEEDGSIASGWIYSNGGKPANIREEDLETPWLTPRDDPLHGRGRT